jgi:long-chain acyl-CoA synthetase
LQAGRVLARLAKQLELGLADVDLTPPQYRALASLAEGKLAASVLAANLAVSKPSVTAVVDGLVERNLVERKHEVDDRRRVAHELTPEGHRLLLAADAAVDERLERIVAHLEDDAEEAAAMDSFDHWKRALDATREARFGGRS